MVIVLWLYYRSLKGPSLTIQAAAELSLLRLKVAVDPVLEANRIITIQGRGLGFLLAVRL